MADECECDFNEDEQAGGADSDDAVNEQMDDAFAAELGDVPMQQVRGQYDRVGADLRNLCEKCGKPLKAVVDNVDARSRVVDGPQDDPDQPAAPRVPKPYDKPLFKPVRQADPNDPTYVVIPVPGASAVPPPPSQNTYEQAVLPQNAPPVQHAADEANAEADADDNVSRCVTLRSVTIVAGVLCAGGVIGLDFCAWYKLLADAGVKTNGAGGVGGTSRIALGGPLNFGPVKTGATETRTLTISNTGGTDLHLQNMELPAGFSGTFPKTAATVAAGKSITVTITFTPVAGQIYSGNVVVGSDASFGSNTTGISGLGVVPETAPAAAPALGLSGFLDFGSIATGLTTTRYLTIFNSGSAVLQVTGVTASDGYAASFSATIAAGSSVLVAVTFAPTAAQAYPGTLTVQGNAGSGTITLTGTGVAPTGDPDTDCSATADHLVSEWNLATNEAAFWTAAANWVGTPTGTPPGLPSYKLQLMVLLYAFTIAIHEMPPVVPLNADIDALANQLYAARNNSELDNQALYRQASTLTSTAGTPLYRYEKINVLTRVIGLIIQANQ